MLRFLGDIKIILVEVISVFKDCLHYLSILNIMSISNCEIDAGWQLWKNNMNCLFSNDQTN